MSRLSGFLSFSRFFLFLSALDHFVSCFTAFTADFFAGLLIWSAFSFSFFASHFLITYLSRPPAAAAAAESIFLFFSSIHTQLTPQPNRRILDLQQQCVCVCVCHYDNLFPLIDWFCVVSALVSSGRHWKFFASPKLAPKLGHIFSKSDNLSAAAMAAIFAFVVAVQQHPILLLLLLFRYTCYSWAFSLTEATTRHYSHLHNFPLFPSSLLCGRFHFYAIFHISPFSFSLYSCCCWCWL